jgi:hypothetical protein
MGFFNRKTKPDDDLIENGLRAKATVQKANMGAMVSYDGYMRQKNVEALLSGEKSMTRYKLDLVVELPGREPYSAHATVSVPMSKVRYMTGGSVLPVLVDPNKESRLNVDWDGEFVQGTLAEMANSNPLIAAAMKGAGVDVEAVSREQQAAIAAGQTPGSLIIGGHLVGATSGVPTQDPLDRIAKLGALRDAGLLTEDEFEAQKAKLLAE